MSGSKLDIPTYIFQMGKVGSSSLMATLAENSPNPIVYAHCYEEMLTDEKQKNLWELHSNRGLPINVITPIREPLSRNVSAFFQNFKRDTGFELTDRDLEVDVVLDLFLRKYPHDICLEWFDSHFSPVFGIDVYERLFPVNQKWETYQKGSVRVLVYRADLDHREQLRVISQFLSLKIADWSYANVSEAKDYGYLYKHFCAEAKLPEPFLSMMKNSKFYRHFWSREEILAYTRQWQASIEPKVLN